MWAQSPGGYRYLTKAAGVGDHLYGKPLKNLDVLLVIIILRDAGSRRLVQLSRCRQWQRSAKRNSLDKIASSHCLSQGLGLRQLCDYSSGMRFSMLIFAQRTDKNAFPL
jgi:hypothetical protein